MARQTTGNTNGAGAKGDDFDLDAFLKDLLPTEDESSANAESTTSQPFADINTATSTAKPVDFFADIVFDDDVDTVPAQDATPQNKKAADKNKQAARQVDLNATMSYDALGEDYPELPLVGIAEAEVAAEVAKSATKKKNASRKSPRVAAPPATPDAEAALDSLAVEPVTAKPGPTKAVPAKKVPAKKHNPEDAAGVITGPETTPATKTATTSKASSAAKAAPDSKVAPAPKTPSTKKKPRAAAASPAIPAIPTAKRKVGLATLANPEDFHEAQLADNSYRIRGGGKRHNRGTPLMIILIAVVVIAGVALLGTVMKDALTDLLTEKPEVEVVTLTSDQTRNAIDSEMPHLLDFVWLTPDEAETAFTEAGWNVFRLGRSASDNADGSATGTEMVRLNSSGTEATLTGYEAGEFSAFDFATLQKSFNGAWSLDLSLGDLGHFATFKYLNFASLSLTDELKHLQEIQGLAGEGSQVIKEGIDENGNSFIYGKTVIGETPYYWQVVGIAFSEYYGGKDRGKLPDTAVFVKCKLATYDFYGAEDLIAEQAPPPPPEPEPEPEPEGEEEAATEEEA
jgi:hypothetical protein